jgi:hypothetical protein
MKSMTIVNMQAATEEKKYVYHYWNIFKVSVSRLHLVHNVHYYSLVAKLSIWMKKNKFSYLVSWFESSATIVLHL